MQTALSVISHSEQETEALGEKLVLFLRPNDMLVLTGELGSGKTVLVRGLAKGMGIDPELVNSPSFTIVNEYTGRERSLYHFDLYRVGDPSELKEIGWDDYQQRDGLVVVEWGEKAGQYLPAAYYLIEFETVGDSERNISVSHVEP
jgi:tRNA threonylcarbamoyladenosine biosynthesis protein TsaE